MDKYQIKKQMDVLLLEFELKVVRWAKAFLLEDMERAERVGIERDAVRGKIRAVLNEIE